MGMWSSVSTSAGSAMQRERWWGTLELLVAAPRHFALVLLPATLGLATVGIYNLVATLLWGRLLFGIDLTIEHPLLFALSILGTVLSFGGARLPVRRLVRPLPRRVGARQLLRVPGLADLRVPRAALAAARLGAPDLLGARADLGHERDPRVGARRHALPDLLLCLGLGAAYVAFGVLVTDRVLRAARERGSLSLT